MRQRRALLLTLVAFSSCTRTDDPAVISVGRTLSEPITIDPTINVAPTIERVSADRNAGDQFGAAVFVYGNRAIVGAPMDDNKDAQDTTRNDNGAAYIFVKSSGTWSQLKKLVEFVGTDGEHLGTSVGVNDESALVGAPDYCSGSAFPCPSAGTVVLFNRDKNGNGQWGEATRLWAQADASTVDTAANARFGVALHMTFETLVVGSAVCKAYVHYRDQGGLNSWGFVKRLTSGATGCTDGFGESVAVDGDLIVVGAPTAAPITVSTGAALVFRRDQGGANGWGLVTILSPDLGRPTHTFGTGVSISGTTVAVGDPTDSQNGANSGSVWVFDKDYGAPDAWALVKNLTASDGAANHRFGATVSLSGTTLAVGAPGANKIYVFSRDFNGSNAWGQATVVSATDATAGDVFGAALSVANDTLAVGEATRAARASGDVTPQNAGAVYVTELVFLGRACIDASTCKSGACVDGVCCDSACDGACDHCLMSLTGLEDGRCGAAYDGTACDDADACTQTASCSGGSCAGADPLACLAIDQCHDAGSCDPVTGSCSTPAKADQSPCDDDNPCTQTDVCAAGFCVGTRPVLCPVAPGDMCHDMGVCNPASGLCTTPQKADGTFCNDGDLCTRRDSCQAGRCVGADTLTCLPLDQCHDPGSCDPRTGACDNPAKPSGATCDDGLFCTVADACASGACIGAMRRCLVGVSCRSGACDEDQDQCSGEPLADNGACDDGDPCTMTDRCSAGSCAGTSYSCNDADACTADGCNGDGTCAHGFAPAACDDHDACSHSDRCDATAGCGGAPYSCDDDNPCTGDSCNGDGTCAHTFNTAPCDDGDLCTTVDVCEHGVCRGTTPTTCAAADPCHTTGVCDPQTGSCSSPAKPDSTPCDDGRYCTINDVCTSGSCGGALRACAPGVSCKGGSCDEDTDRCTGAELLNGSPCNDGDHCTKDDVCSAGSCAGAAYSCDDQNPCTDDQCNGAGGCTRTDNRTACDDHNPCSVADVCFGGQCRGATYSCSDANPCTTDSCDGNGSCARSANADPCSDDDLCTGGDHCAAGACVAGTIDTCVDSGPRQDGGPPGGDQGSAGGDPVTPAGHERRGCGCEARGGDGGGLFGACVGVVLVGGRRRSRRLGDLPVDRDRAWVHR